MFESLREGSLPEADLGVERGGELLRHGGVADLLDLHVLENLAGKLLESVDVDGTLVGGVEVATTSAELGNRADLLRQSQNNDDDGSCHSRLRNRKRDRGGCRRKSSWQHHSSSC